MSETLLEVIQRTIPNHRHNIDVRVLSNVVHFVHGKFVAATIVNPTQKETLERLFIEITKMPEVTDEARNS